MKLPNYNQAVVEDAKIRDYLLSETHPVGRYKARFFLSLGYEVSAWVQLKSDVIALVAAHDAVDAGRGPWGRKYTVDGMLGVPAEARVRTVWLVPNSGANPRFVTAYPE